MSGQNTSPKRYPKNEASQPMIYQIRIEGHLGQQWAEMFDGLTIKLEGNGDTLISGAVIDQAALHGLLRKVRDLGMKLISVKFVGPVAQEPSEGQ